MRGLFLYARSTRGRRKTVPLLLGLPAIGVVLAACGVGTSETADPSEDEVTVDNCGEEIAFPAPAEDIFVNHGIAVSTFFELGAEDQISASTGISKEAQEVLSEIYGAQRMTDLPVVSEEYATLENIVGKDPQAMIAGFSWGYSFEDDLTPSRLIEDYDIPSYTLSQTCLQGSDDAQGIMPPWEAMFTDLDNLGKIVGKEGEAKRISQRAEENITELESAPQDEDVPTVLFAGLTLEDGILSVGDRSAAYAIIETAGARNLPAAEINDDQQTLSWETVAAAKPDFIMIGEFSGDYEDDVEELKTNPATKDIPAVKNNRFLRIPGLMTRGTPLMVDAAEHLRKALEEDGLLPESSIEPRLQLDSK